MSLSTQIKVLGGLPSAGSPPASSLSADEIVQHLGTTGGTANARTLSGSTLVLAAGLRISFISHTANSGSVTLDIGEGSGAVPLYFPSFATPNQPANLSASQLFAGLPVVAEYSASGYWVVVSALPLGAANIPSTLNATAFVGAANLSAGGYFSGTFSNGSSNAPMLIAGGSLSNNAYALFSGASAGTSESQSSGGFVRLYGNSHASKPGDAEYYTGTASGAAHSFFDKNGAEQLKIDENGAAANILRAAQIQVASSALYINGVEIYRADSSNWFGAWGGGNAGDPRIIMYGKDNATYPGAHQQFASLSTRSASTAFAVCPVATGDYGFVDLRENQYAGSSPSTWGALIWVDTAGAVTLNSPVYGTVSSTFVNSSSPGAAEIGIYVSAGVLYCKPGSSFTGKIATFSKIGKA